MVQFWYSFGTVLVQFWVKVYHHGTVLVHFWYSFGTVLGESVPSCSEITIFLVF